jgi:hypothetical protein
MNSPQRHPNHTLEERSILFFQQYAPSDWNVYPPGRDYGQDLHVEIAEHGEYRGLELIVQLKSSHEPNIQDNHEKQVFSTSTFNYLRRNLRVALVVKYVLSENEAYWMLLKDIPDPNPDSKTFLIYIPRENRVAALNWTIISDYVREVTGNKLAAIKIVNTQND